MKRPVIIALPLAMALLCLLPASPAGAQPKSVAVLGLEVVDSGGGMSMGTVRLARALTENLREQATLGQGPYRLAPNSKKGLAEMKLLAGCDDEGPRCMASIGQALSAQVLLFGKLERTKGGARVKLQLIDVAAARKISGVTDVIPEAEWDGLDRWARSLYGRLAGIPVQGSLVVQSNATTGTVFVDGSRAAQLTGGTATVENLSEGRHRVAVESPGYRRWNGEVGVRAGESSRLSVELEAVSSTARPDITDEEPGGGARVAAWTFLGIGAAAGAFQAINWFVLREDAMDDVETATAGLSTSDKETLMTNFSSSFDGSGRTSDMCGVLSAADDQGIVLTSDAELRDACDRGELTATLSYAAIGVTAVAGAAAAFFFYKGYVSAGDDTGGERSTVRVTPEMGPNRAGLGIAIDF